MSWRSWEIRIELTLDLQSDLIKQETHKRLDKSDWANYENMISLNWRLDCRRRDINQQAHRVSQNCPSFKAKLIKHPSYQRTLGDWSIRSQNWQGGSAAVGKVLLNLLLMEMIVKGMVGPSRILQLILQRIRCDPLTLKFWFFLPTSTKLVLRQHKLTFEELEF